MIVERLVPFDRRAQVAQRERIEDPVPVGPTVGLEIGVAVVGRLFLQ